MPAEGAWVLYLGDQLTTACHVADHRFQNFEAVASWHCFMLRHADITSHFRAVQNVRKIHRLPKLCHWIVSMNILTCLASCSISVTICIHALHVTLKYCRIVAKGMCWLHAVVQFTVIKITDIRNAFVENTGVKVVPPKHSWRYSARWKQSTSQNCMALSWADRPKPWEVLHVHGDLVSHFKLLWCTLLCLSPVHAQAASSLNDRTIRRWTIHYPHDSHRWWELGTTPCRTCVVVPFTKDTWLARNNSDMYVRTYAFETYTEQQQEPQPFANRTCYSLTGTTYVQIW